MATTVFCCGFECGLIAQSTGGLNSNPAHWFRNGGTTPTIVNTTVRSGVRSCRYNLSSQSSQMITQVPPATHTVARFYIRFASLPSVDTYLFWVGTTTGQIGLGFEQATSTIKCATQGSPITFGASGVEVTTGVWYLIDVHLNQTSGAMTIDAKVDDVALTQKTSPSTAIIEEFKFGSSKPVSGEWFIDDFLLSVTAADYPLGQGYINHFVPVSDGSHNITGPNEFEYGATGTDITNVSTDVYSYLDDDPLDAYALLSDYILARNPNVGLHDSSGYVEVVFGPAPGISAPVAAPRAVDIVIGNFLKGDDLSHGNARFYLVDNGTADLVTNRVSTDASDTSFVEFERKHYADPPSGGANFTLSGAGNFNDLRLRFKPATCNNQGGRFTGAVIEAEFSSEPPPPPPPGGAYACAGVIPAFTSPDQDKIDALKALRAAGTGIEAYELVKIEWPSDTRYYGVLQTDEVASVAPDVSPIEVRLLPDSSPDWFLPVKIDAAIGDEEVDLTFWDGDGEMSDLLVEHGEGIRVELYYWFPQTLLLLPIWHGHLRQEDDAEVDICKVKAVQGFRSSEGMLPRRAHYKECQAIFGGVFDTQEEIDQNDCPYNAHIGGGVGTPGFTSCPRRTRDDCIARLGNNANYMLSHATVATTLINNQTHGDRLYSTSQGNETNLKEPVPVVMGTKRIYGMPVMAYRKDFNNNTPDHGFFTALYEAGEGPNDALSGARISVGGATQDAVAMHYNYRLGTKPQAPVNPITIHGYASTAHIVYVFGWVDPSEVSPGDASASIIVRGLNNIRIYTDDTTYTEEYSDNRAWHIARMLTDKRWGYGYDYDRLDIGSFIEAACWCSNLVQFVDDNGDAYNHVRARSDIELRGRKVQQQIEDICMAGRLSRPFVFNGKIHIAPLREMTSAELAAAPVFTDTGSSRNIIQEEIEPGVFKTTLRRSRISDLDLPNRIECTYDEAASDWTEQPLRPVEDVDAQLRAGRVVGDFSRKINSKTYGLAGVTIEGHGLKVATSLRDLGPFDEGGLQNNLRLKFRIWFIDSLDLYPTKVVKVVSAQITRYGFDYFRVIEMERKSDLEVELTCQAYNETYMAAFETLYGGLPEMPADPAEPTGPDAELPPEPVEFGAITYGAGVLSISAD